jgi:hypothetical protein
MDGIFSKLFYYLDLTLIPGVEVWTPTPYLVVFLTGNYL